jgi:hypothetical protein
MSELERVVYRYFYEDSNASVLYEIDEIEINKMIRNMKKYERPDILSIYDNKIIGIEHFEFDSYKNDRKGSDFQRKHSVIDNKMKEAMKNDLKTKDTVILHDKIECTSSLKNYYKNFIKVFNLHYEKIDEYNEHILEDFDCENKIIYFWFFVEDVTPLGNYYFDDKRNICLLNPLFSKEIRDLLLKSPKIKGIILGQQTMDGKKVTIIINDTNTMDKFKKYNDEVTDKDYFSFEPHTTGFATLIPKEELEGVDSNV